MEITATTEGKFKMSSTYRIARTFYDDHKNRGLPSGHIIKNMKSTVIVELDEDDYSELLNDAEYYGWDMMKEIDSSLKYICSSARRVFDSLNTQGWPTGELSDEYKEAKRIVAEEIAFQQSDEGKALRKQAIEDEQKRADEYEMQHQEIVARMKMRYAEYQ